MEKKILGLLRKKREINQELNDIRKIVGTPSNPGFLLLVLGLVIGLPFVTLILYREYFEPDVEIYQNSIYHTDEYVTNNVKQYMDIGNRSECMSIMSEGRIAYYCETK